MSLKAGRVGVKPSEVTKGGKIKGGGGSPYVLPVATATTLGGVKPVTKTATMTKEVGVDSEGRLYVEPSEGGEGWKDLKNYLQSSGTQYIDTGYTVAEDTELELVADINSNNSNYACAFGARNSSGDTYSTSPVIFFVIFGGQTNYAPQFASTSVPANCPSGVYNTKARLFLNRYSGSIENKNKLIVAQAIDYHEGYLPSATNKVFLFNLNQGGSSAGTQCACTMKLYRFRIYEGDTLVHEFIPWQDNGVACLKDTVTGNLKYNAGTGDFIYGTDTD